MTRSFVGLTAPPAIIGIILWAAMCGIARAQAIAIIHAKAYIIPGNEPAPDTTIVVENGRISVAGTALTPPVGARVIDAHGKIVTPGLMNSGTELGLVESGTDDTKDHSVTSGPLGAAFDVQYALNPNSTLLPLARADGLTRAIAFPQASAGPPFSGFGAALRLSEGEDNLDRRRVALFANVGGMSAAQGTGSRSAQWGAIRTALDEAVYYVNSQQIHEPGARETYRKDQLLSRINIAALVPVVRGATPLAIATQRESDIRQAVQLAADYKFRIIIIGGDEAWRVAALLASRKIPVVLDPYDDTPATFDQIGARADNAALLARSGVMISFFAPGVHMSHNAGSIIREGAGIAVAHGLSWNDALRALTVNPARTWNIADHYGTLEPGKDADIIIWDGDPLEPMSAPGVVLIKGKEVSARSRQTELEKRYSPRQTDNAWPPPFR